jgi:integrase
MATVERYETVSGTTLYRVRYRTPDHRSTQKRGFTTKRDAERWANKVEVTKTTGQYVAPSLGRVTVGELGPAWLERQRGHMKPSGFRTYESMWRNHVVDRARGVKLPKRPPQRNVYLTAAQLGRLADEAGRYLSLVLLLGVGGLRWGEAAALRVSDVDFLRRRIGLHRNAVEVNGKFAVGSLKSNKNRTVALPAFVVDALAETAKGKSRDDLLWPSRAGGYLASPATGSWLAGAVQRCRETDPTFPRVTAHDLRHTAASLAISAGANPKEVQRMLGHASAAMTLDVYADLFDSDLETVAENVAKMWPRQA